MDDLLTYAEAARVLNLKLGTLYALVAQGRVPHVRLGRRLVRFSRTELDRWLSEEHLPAIVELFSESEGETPAQCRSNEGKTLNPFPLPQQSTYRTPCTNPSSSSLSRPPLYPAYSDSLSIMQCLKQMHCIPSCRNELA